MKTFDLWYSRVDAEALIAQFQRHGERQAPQADGEERRQDAGEGQPAGVQQAHDDSRWRAADRRRPAADRADRGPRRRPRYRGVRARA